MCEIGAYRCILLLPPFHGIRVEVVFHCYSIRCKIRLGAHHINLKYILASGGVLSVFRPSVHILKNKWTLQVQR